MNPLLPKLLNLSTSDNDAEALLAVRKANEILKADNLTWEKVLTDKDWKKKYYALAADYNKLVERINRSNVQQYAGYAAAQAAQQRKRGFFW